MSFESPANTTFTAGQNVIIRDEEWLVKNVDKRDGGNTLTCDGVSELVRGVEAKFHTAIDRNIEVLDPRQTKLVADQSSRFIDSRLFIESHLKHTVVNDDQIRIGHRAAMKKENYQLEPARQALKQTRQRILIADSVGLGKTLEAGILVSELMARGRGRRILVVAVKSMLVQFQKEFWTRFCIPLTRLDSIAIQRIRTEIPANHNPFLQYDKSIISIDTLKGNDQYRRFLETAYWDIIIIDEAHNVAKRGSKQSQRSRLAEILADRSDTLIMLSATPHDGRATSFASLMNMLDPTAIPDTESYAQTDYSSKGLVIRRFKKDLRAQTGQSMQEADYLGVNCLASEQEEAAIDAIARLREVRNSLQVLGIEKGFLSSPAACLESVRERIKRLEAIGTEDTEGKRAEEMSSLEALLPLLDEIRPAQFSKYHRLLDELRNSDSSLCWIPSNEDRLVIFTERIATLNWLHDHLQRDLKLKSSEVAVAHGQLNDIELQQVVDDFGNASKPLKLLICSDVAAEGINLHFLSHRLIHFDLPWSLMTYSQRNGRVDRYGQERKPIIAQLITRTNNDLISGDIRILNLLSEKSREAERNIGDPALLMGKFDPDEEEKVVQKIMLSDNKETALDKETKETTSEAESLLDIFCGTSSTTSVEEVTVAETSLFASDFDYCTNALRRLTPEIDDLSVVVNETEQTIEVTAPEELKYRYRRLPSEVRPDDETGRLVLTSSISRMNEAIEYGRTGEDTWPYEQYLWRLSPVTDWLNDRMRVLYHRNEAPLIVLSDGMQEKQDIFLVSGLFPNRRSHPLFFEQVAVEFIDGVYVSVKDYEQLEQWSQLQSDQLVNRGRGTPFLKEVEALVAEAVKQAEDHFEALSSEFKDKLELNLNKQVNELDSLESRQIDALNEWLEKSGQPEQLKKQKRDVRKKEIRNTFDNFVDWVEESMQLSEQPAVRLIAVFTGRTA